MEKLIADAVAWIATFGMFLYVVGCTTGSASIVEPIKSPIVKVKKVGAVKVQQVIKAKVVDVHDGDTWYINYKGSDFKANKHGLLKVRLHITDTPEYDERRHNFQQPYGKEAQIRVKKLLLGKEVTLKVGVKSYDRPVCDVLVDGKDLALILVKEGLAWVDPRYIKTKNNLLKEQLNRNVLLNLSDIKDEDRELLTALNGARKAKIGIWSQKKPVAPWAFRGN